MLKNYYLKIAVLCILALWFVFCGGGPGTYASDNWQVTINKVYYEKDYQSGAKHYSGLAINLLVKYIGPRGKVNAPSIYLTDKKSVKRMATLIHLGIEKFNASGILLKAWLGDKETKFDLKPGDSLKKDGFMLLWKMQEAKGDYKLVIGDISPIPISL